MFFSGNVHRCTAIDAVAARYSGTTKDAHFRSECFFFHDINWLYWAARGMWHYCFKLVQCNTKQNILASPGYRMLTDPDQMGEKFKFFALRQSSANGTPVGFLNIPVDCAWRGAFGDGCTISVSSDKWPVKLSTSGDSMLVQKRRWAVDTYAVTDFVLLMWIEKNGSFCFERPVACLHMFFWFSYFLVFSKTIAAPPNWQQFDLKKTLY